MFMTPSLEKTLTRLEAVLLKQLEAHERLLSHMDEKRIALRRADRQRITDCGRLENQQVQAISELEKERLQLVADLTLAVFPAATEPMRMGDLAERLGEPTRGRLLVLRQQLLAKMEAVREQSRTTRSATESLMKHMQGLVMKVGSLCNGIPVYNNQGAAPRRALAVSTFNTTA